MNILKYCCDKINICFATFLITLSLCSYAHATEILLLAGSEGGNGRSYNYYNYAGVVAPLFSSQFGSGFVQKYWVDVFGYDYPSGNRTIDASAVGAEAAFGYQQAWNNGWANVFVGGRYSNMWLSPDNPDSKVRGSQVRVKLQAEVDQIMFTNLKFNAIGSYILESDSYWARVRALLRIRKELFTGPELVSMGDPDYRAWQFGWVLTGFEVFPKGYLGFKAGARTTEHADSGWYGGIEFSKLF